MEKDRKRLTIGVLVSGITDDFTRSLCKGMMKKAKEKDVSLVVLPGKYIDRDSEGEPDLMYEYQNGTVLSYATEETVDGIIAAASCIGCLTTTQRIEELMHQYDGIPCVLAVTKMDGYAGVNFDNYTGICDGVEYLIERLHYTEIGMLGGPDGNTDAQERKAAFRTILEKHGIAWDEKRYVKGALCDFDANTIEHFLDNNPDLQAVVCVNDGVARSLYGVMERRGLVPGKDISVLGYDNTDWAKQASPSLSTVMADPSDIGEGCVEQLLKLLAGEEIESIVVPTRFIKRDSFARPNGFAGLEGLGTDLKKLTERYFDDIFYRYKYDDADGELRKVNKAFYRFMEYLESWSDNAAQRDLKLENVESYLDGFMNHKVIKYADVENMLAVFEALYEELMFRQTEETGRLRIGALFAVLYERAAHVMNYYMGAAIIEESAYNNSLKSFVRDMLQFERGNDQSYGFLLGKLDWLQIKNAYIFTYEEPIMNLDREMFSIPDSLYLKAMQRGEEITVLSSIDQKIAFCDIFKPEVLGIEEACNLVVLPLFFNEMLYGVLVCDLTDGIFENGEFLCNQMSAAVKMIDLLKNNESIQQQLEESMATLRENNIALDNLSKSDGLTGIRNRRGFEDAAERMCKFCKSDDRVVFTAYVDMNNLKIINDRYGHDDGDFSLKVIGDILVKVFGEEGVVGRIGGDEFACVLPVPKEQNAQELLDEIYAEFTAFNKESDKPYNITVSAGAYLLQPTDDLTLQQALSLADEQLYEVKKHRTREVAKTPVAVAL